MFPFETLKTRSKRIAVSRQEIEEDISIEGRHLKKKVNSKSEEKKRRKSIEKTTK